MGKSSERFMRVYIDRWLDDERIRGTGDDGQRIGGLTLEQEGAYWRLCATQFRQRDGYLPNRRAFLLDASAAASADYERIIIPVIRRFFKTTRDGSKLYNLRVRSEWEKSHSKSRQAAEAAELKWRREKHRLSLLNADAAADAYADAACERERERDITDTPPTPSPFSGQTDPPAPPACAGGNAADPAGRVDPDDGSDTDITAPERESLGRDDDVERVDLQTAGRVERVVRHAQRRSKSTDGLRPGRDRERVDPLDDPIGRVLRAMAARGFRDLASERDVQRAVRRRLRLATVGEIEAEIETWPDSWADLPAWVLPKKLRERARKLANAL